MPTVLTIAGSDPSGGAGIQADLKTFESFGVKGLSAVTAITAQSEKEVFGINPVSADILTQQLYSAVKNEKVSAVKIGMLASFSNVKAVAMFLRTLKIQHVVIDPVFTSTSGAPLLETNALNIFKNELLPFASVITPNIDEAGVLTGMRIWNIGTMKDAAKQIYTEIVSFKNQIPPNPPLQRGEHQTSTSLKKIIPPCPPLEKGGNVNVPHFEKGGQGGFDLAVLIKGGHMAGDALDILFDGKNFTEFSAKRIAGKPKHGTGCRLSSAIAAGIANGKSLADAVLEAKKYVKEYINNSTL